MGKVTIDTDHLEQVIRSVTKVYSEQNKAAQAPVIDGGIGIGGSKCDMSKCVISHARMLEHIESGGGALWDGAIHTSAETLPDAIEVAEAQGDEETAYVERQKLKDEMARLKAKLAAKGISEEDEDDDEVEDEETGTGIPDLQTGLNAGVFTTDQETQGQLQGAQNTQVPPSVNRAENPETLVNLTPPSTDATNVPTQIGKETPPEKSVKKNEGKPETKTE